jgi:hypothetical protein
MDYLRNRYPESFVDYKEKIDKSWSKFN